VRDYDAVVRNPFRASHVWPILVVVVLVALVVGTGFLLARVGSLGRELSAAQSSAVSLAAQLRQQTERSASLQASVDRATRSIRQLRKEARVRQSCEGGRFGPGPYVWLVPAKGPPGTKVEIFGDCFLGSWWRHWRGGYRMFLIRGLPTPPECELIIGVDDPVLTFSNGRAVGSFTVPSGVGSCFQNLYKRQLTPGTYGLGIACHACEVAKFRVT
jgi:Sec-independent protein translocase protein TatA